MAGGAGHRRAANHVVRHGEQQLHLVIGQGPAFFIGRDIVPHLLQAAHAGQRHGHLGQALQEAEGPGRNTLIGTGCLQLCGVLRLQIRQLTASDRLHHPHRDIPLLQQLQLALRILECPVEPVQLDLREFHILAVRLQKAADRGNVAMRGEAEMADTPLALLLHQIRMSAVLGVKILLDVHLADIVEQIEIEVADAALAELLFEDFLDLAHVAQVIAGKLGGEIEALPGILLKELAHHQLGIAAVVSPRGVIVVDAMGHAVIKDGLGRRFVDGRIVAVHHRQTHVAHAQSGELQILECVVNHDVSPLFKTQCDFAFVSAENV